MENLIFRDEWNCNDGELETRFVVDKVMDTKLIEWKLDLVLWIAKDLIQQC